MGKKIGQRIAERRKALDMTQEDLANRLGYKSRSSINKIELGVNDITQSKIADFAKALGTTPAYLMGWEDEEIEMQRKQALEAAFNDRPEMRTLFSVAKDASKEDIEKTIKILEALKK